MSAESLITETTHTTPAHSRVPGEASAPLVDIGTHRTSLRASVLAIVRYRQLLKHLVLKDLKLKYRGSVLGFVWSLLNPLVMLTVYTVAFKYIMGIRGSGFVFLLMIGILAWTFFASSVQMSAGGIIDNGGLLKTIFFPRAVLPVATVLFNLWQFLLTAAVFLPILAVIYQRPPGASALVLPIFIALQLVMTIGLGLVIATGTAFFRDLRHLLEIGLAIMFWTTPILYDFRSIPGVWQWPVLLSPLSSFVLAYQDILYYGQWPELRVWAVASVYTTAAVLGGGLLFVRFQDDFAERI
jgi:lipopolysaccharide transport system permease protein